MLFMGAGRMASAIVKGLLQAKVLSANEIACTSAADGTGELLAAGTGIGFTEDPLSVLDEVDTVVLACKPQQLSQLSEAVCAGVRGKLLISILAGTTVAKLRSVFNAPRNIVRAMPNTPAQIGKGITAYCSMQPLDATDLKLTGQLMASMGDFLPVAESQLDAVTALSGSGPAYVFEFIAALRDAGVAAGLDASTSYRLALQTTLGAAALLEAVPESPETHRNWVSSPGGTTLAGLSVLEKNNFRTLLVDTVLAAKRRSVELSKL